MFEWLKVMSVHSFTQRHFESSESTIEPLGLLARNFADMEKEDKDKSEIEVSNENKAADNT